jgi:DNA repair protein RecO (recombination protein O)
VFRSIILKKEDRGEADEVVIFLGRDLGWARGIAKNSKKSRIRFGGHLEPFSLVELTLRPRRRDDLVWIDESQVLNGFLGLRSDLKRFAVAAYFLELASIFLPEGHPDNALFDFLEGFLTRLDGAGFTDLEFFKLEIQLLGILGYEPGFSVCVCCGKEFAPGREAVFDLTLGGACHSDCCSGTGLGKPLLLSANTRAIMRKTLESNEETVRRLKLSKNSAAELRSALSAFARYLRGKEINSAVFMEQMGF